MTGEPDTAFEAQLATLLKERADRATVDSQLSQLFDEQPVNVRRPGGVTRWWIAVAAVVVVISGAALALVPDGISLGTTDSLGSASDQEDRGPAPGSAADVVNLVVWMDPGIDPSRAQAVASLLDGSTFVTQFEYVDQEATYADFVEYFADQPEVIELVEPESLPTSFLVQTAAPDVVIDLVRYQDGVDQVEVASPDE